MKRIFLTELLKLAEKEHYKPKENSDRNFYIKDALSTCLN